MSTEQTLFSEQLAEFSNGTVDAELTAKLAELIRQVRVTQGTGAVTLQIGASLDMKAKDLDVVNLKYKVSSRIPNRPLDPDRFKSFGDGALETMPEPTLRSVG